MALPYALALWQGRTLGSVPTPGFSETGERRTGSSPRLRLIYTQRLSSQFYEERVHGLFVRRQYHRVRAARIE